MKLKDLYVLKGIKYKLGSRDRAVGLDCFTLILTYLKMLGKEIPLYFEEMSLEEFDYTAYYEQDPKTAMETAMRFIQLFAPEVKLNKAKSTRPGWILLIKSKSKNKLPAVFAIDTGGGNLITLEQNVGVTFLAKRNFDIERAFVL